MDDDMHMAQIAFRAITNETKWIFMCLWEYVRAFLHATAYVNESAREYLMRRAHSHVHLFKTH